MYIYFLLSSPETQNRKFDFFTITSVVFKLSKVHSVEPHDKLVSTMETRSRTTKLIVKNVEMLESSKFDKFDKVSQWLDKLDTFEFQQHQKNPHIGAPSNQQNTSSRMSQDKNDDFFDSDSSVNTGMSNKSKLFLVTFSFFFFLSFSSLHSDEPEK